MRIMSGQDRSAAAAHETINLLYKVRTLAVQQTPVRDYRTMLLWLSRAGEHFLEVVSGRSVLGRSADCRDGQDRDGPLRVEGRLLLGHVASEVRVGPGAAGGSFAGQHVCGSRLVGQAAPGSWVF
jgi:hypothetical protein